MRERGRTGDDRAATIVVLNGTSSAGKTTHDLWIKGGGTTVHTKLLKPGQHVFLTTTLKKGVRYRFWCHFDAHAALGMSLYITPR